MLVLSLILIALPYLQRGADLKRRLIPNSRSLSDCWFQTQGLLDYTTMNFSQRMMGRHLSVFQQCEAS